ncbi:MAG: competence/damage-inducible protein A [Candidatus Dormibacteraeota bacterium]|uniref:Competence/damage-inducible protein A n=1 Tax=Candidatus Aeolococcus gillhamiae TaxID=3127015 RepID=A0A934N9Y7_9BACT|nr:competence/damage-inducible protein A [Candidatus Dormibacteraeota bacterium]
MAETPATVIIAVGDEVLSGHTQDTNSAFLAARAFAAGFPVRRIEVVADRLEDVADAIQRAVSDGGVTRVVVCGGIGPTPDDRTFEAVAGALGRPLEENPIALASITAIVARMHAAGWVADDVVSEGNRRCAMVPAGGLVLANRRGMAPPMAYELAPDRWLFILPGVPREFTTIVQEELIPRFFAGGTASLVVEVRYRGVPEAELYTPMRRLAEEFPEVAAGSYPQTEARQVIIRLRGLDRERVHAATLRMLELDGRGEPVDADKEKEESASSPLFGSR